MTKNILKTNVILSIFDSFLKEFFGFSVYLSTDHSTSSGCKILKDLFATCRSTLDVGDLNKTYLMLVVSKSVKRIIFKL